MNAALHVSSLQGGWWENKHNASLADGVTYEGIMNRFVQDDEKQKERLTDINEQE